MKILAIETSCDETSIAVLQTEKDGVFMHPKSVNSSEYAHPNFKILSNIVSSQVKIHAPFGGVVPMLAKREHQRNLLPILKQALKEAKILKNYESGIRNQELKIHNSKFMILNSILDREPELLKKLLPFLKNYERPKIDLIAVTNGPGLEPALWVGVNFAKALGYYWNLPVMPVNHVEAHIAANWLNQKDKITFPVISLIVSGGHTQLVLMRGFGKPPHQTSAGKARRGAQCSLWCGGKYKILGETRDDAAGESFDKLAKMLNLGYPGGPIVSKLADKFKSLPTSLSKGRNAPSFLKEGRGGFKNLVKLPRPMINSKDYDFSFSGLKTAALYFVKTLNKKTLKKLTPAICAEFQQAAIDVLVSKTIRAAKEYNVRSVLLSGGVAANDLLRNTLEKESESRGFEFSVPPKEFCTDNAAMIALTAAKKTKKNNWQKIMVDANLRLR
jgi:N6-L-threonylcarbamoyladenine synthase